MKDELRELRAALKSGEYDGTHVMRAWIAVDELAALQEREQKLERAVSVLTGSNSSWAMNVSDGDEELILELVHDISCV